MDTKEVSEQHIEPTPQSMGVYEVSRISSVLYLNTARLICGVMPESEEEQTS